VAEIPDKSIPTVDRQNPQRQRNCGQYLAFMKHFYSDGNIADSFNVYGYSAAQLLVKVLTRCGKPHARQRDAAGGKPAGSAAADAASGNSHQHQRR
jgi:hypothetical protein